MWRRHDWLVPYLNGAPFGDKPPLFFWSILLGWRLLGVNQWWPRLLAPLYSLLSLWMLVRLVRKLSSDADESAKLTLLFMSGALWVTYSTLLLFDTLLTLCVLLALLGVVAAWKGRPISGWMVFGLGVGFGVLTKGPVALVHVVPVAALAPWWAGERRPRWIRWYAGLLTGLALGTAVALSWALPAGARGGPAYQNAILWHQTAGRVFHAFAHQRPWWWYLPLLPLVLFPWIAWPPLWRAVLALRREPLPLPARFAVAWIAPSFVLLSLISGKQAHYVIPLLPGFAMLAAGAFASGFRPGRAWDAALPASVLLLLGIAALVIPIVREPWWATQLSPMWAAFPIAGAVLLYRAGRQPRQLLLLGLVSPAILLWAQLAARNISHRCCDLQPIAAFLQEVERSGRPLAYLGHYQGQFHFLGRLEQPIDEVTPTRLAAWTRDHPGGLVIQEERRITGGVALRTWPYRGGVIAVRQTNGVLTAPNR
jgi:4-amino-4-deoxy-L-arabinose transferase-like glycosyltransferase